MDRRASMEPGHEDREYASAKAFATFTVPPQWSPVMKTGNTRRSLHRIPHRHEASMEPGHEDREYLLPVKLALSRDRRLNGARS